VKLALRLDLYRAANLSVPVDLVQEAEQLGYHSVWSAEAYGTDALSPLAYLAAFTNRIKLGTAVVQLAARPPTTLAMHAMTIDAMAGGGRVIIGVGVSGPQIVEGWYGQPWGHPTSRLRDYLTIVRKVMDRDAPVVHEGPRNTELCAELCEGWLPMGLPPEGVEAFAEPLEEGWAKRGGRPESFEVFSGCNVQITDDVAGTLDAMRPLTAMYVGGMGSRTHNFHREAMARRGFPDAAARIQELWLAGHKQEAVAAVPDEYLEQGSLIGSEQRIRARWPGIGAPGVTGLIIGAPGAAELRLLAKLAGTRELV